MIPTTRQLDPVGHVLKMLARVDDPRERLGAIRAVRAELAEKKESFNELTRDTILELRALDSPATWQEIGDLLKISAQRAHQIASEQLTKGTPT